MPPRALVAFAVLAASVAVLRIGATFDDLVQTSDEPAHIAAGMEWLTAGRYEIEYLHPPLARITAGLGPFLIGTELPTDGSMLDRGNEVLYGTGNYFTTLGAARWGSVVFFLLALIVIWLWGRLLFGEVVAVAAVLILSLLPEPLAHGGLATTDMAGASTTLLALYAFDLWVRKPGVALSIGLGVASGLALLTKFSAILFLPIGALVLLIAFAADQKTTISQRVEWQPRRFVAGGVLALVTCFFLVWAGYRFSVSPLSQKHPPLPEELIEMYGDRLSPGLLSYVTSHIPVPAPEFLIGLYQVKMYNEVGHPAYLNGQVRRGGWWYYFPTAFAVKSPLPFLIFILIGAAFTFRSGFSWRQSTPLVIALAVLLLACTSRLNLGLRYILLVFPLLSITAAVGLSRLLSKRSTSLVGAGLLCWLIAASVLAHPDYLSYFNEPFRPRDDRILLDSNLDWGQDLERLGRRLKELGVERVALSYFGSARPETHVGAMITPLYPGECVTGMLAISEMNLKGIGLGRMPGPDGSPTHGFEWLEHVGPPEMIGHSIRLYEVGRDECP